MITKFIIRKGAKFTGIKKLPAQTKPKLKTFTDEARLLRQHRAEKLARGTEYKAMDVGLQRIRAKSLQLFGSNKIKTKQAQGIIKRGEIRAIKIARKKGIQTLESKSAKLSVPIRRFGSQKTKARIGMSESEGKILGFAPREMSSEMKAFYSKGKPSALVKKHRATLSKVYTKFPKQFVIDKKTGSVKRNKWNIPVISAKGKRGQLKSHYRAAAKSELKQAKIDRKIFRDTTVQLQTGKTLKGKPIWKTIRSPEKTYDVVTKRWKRTKI